MRTTLLLAGLLAFLPTLTATAQVAGEVPDPTATAPKILLKYGVFDPVEQLPPVAPALAGGNDTTLWLVQYDRFPTDADRTEILRLGGEIITYMPEKAYLVRVASGGAAALSQAPHVRWTGFYHPAYRLEPELLVEFNQGRIAPERKYNFVVADKHKDKPALITAIRAMGGRVDHVHPESILFTATLNGLQLLQAARLDQVIWIDRWTESSTDMNNVRIVGGGNHVETNGKYTGAGIRGHLYEGLEIGHMDFNTKPVVVESCPNPDTHGHCTAGIVFGNGKSISSARGMAPDAQAYFTNRSCVTTGMSRYQVLQKVVNTHKCFFTTASWGGSRTTSYTSISADTDDIIFNLDIPWTQSQSNAGATSIPRNSRPEAWAKNVFAIGAVYHYDNSNVGDDKWAKGGSIGFAADGRIKPDLCAYYDKIRCSDRTGTAGYSSGNYYDNFGGTSAATPIVAGHNALAIQMFTDGIFNNALRKPTGTRFENKPHFTTLRALQIACARQYSFTSTSTDNKREHQGWGFPNLKTMYDNRNKMFIVDETDLLTQGRSKVYPIYVTAGTPELKVAMCYNDPKGNPSSSIARINDLDLRVYRGSLSYRGNYGLKTRTTSLSGGSYDSRDTTEVVIIPKPAAGVWYVSVYARTVAADNHKETRTVDVDYGLVVNGGVLRGNQCAFYVPDSDPDTGGCNVIPFGYDSTSWRNQKAQFIIRQDDLLAKSGNITSLGFAPCHSGRHTFSSIVVRMSSVTAGHTMSTSFNTNMPRPVTVLSAKNYTWVRTKGRWNSVGLQKPFFYSGSGDIVVEITVTGTDFSIGSYASFHTGNRERVYAYNWTGSPPSSGTMGTSSALKMKVGFGCADRNVYGLGIAPGRDPSVAVPAYSTTYTSSSSTRGFWFQAPLDFTITGLRVPNEKSQTRQVVEVFKRSTPPGTYPATSTGGQIFYKAGELASRIIPVNLEIKAGEYVCILGACGSTSNAYNSYGSSGPYEGTILGHPVTLNRLLTQNNIFAGGNKPYSSETSSIGRIEVYVKNHLPMPKFSSTFSGNLTRGFYFQAPKDFNIIGLRVPDETYFGRQAVEVYRLKAKPPAFPATASGGRAFIGVNFPSNRVIPCYLSIKAGEWVGILGGCGNTTTIRNSYGSVAPTSRIRGSSVKLYRFITQSNLFTGGNKPYSAEDTGVIGRIEVFTSGEGFGATAGQMPQLGKTWEIQLNAATASSTAFLNIGLSNSSIFSVPLPWNLGFLGITGGNLYTDLTLLVPVKTDAQGIGRLSVTLPTVTSSIGAKFYAQGLQLNTLAPGSVVLSDYLRVVAGN